MIDGIASNKTLNNHLVVEGQSLKQSAPSTGISATFLARAKVSPVRHYNQLDKLIDA